ncbi:MAG: glycosyltransferase [Saprospiraceae bacterium]|nr:glycosyltransferase [Saprospiraceae bacterium]
MSSRPPFFSIVTVCKNAEASIERSIKSIIDQPVRDFELIIIDGVSDDATLDIISTYQKHITYFVSEPDRGISHALNKGIDAASGEYILFVNADDWLHNNILGKVRQFIRKYPGYDLYCGGSSFYNGKIHEVDSYSDWKNIGEETSIHHASTVFKSSVFAKHGAFDETYSLAMDYELFLRFYQQKARFLNIPILVANRSLHGISYSNPVKSMKETRRARSKYFSPLNTWKTFYKSLFKDTIGRILKALPYFRNYYKKYWAKKNERIK